MKIKNRFNGKLIIEVVDLRNADLHYANLHYANLRNADLRNANLRNADLCGADLCGADLHNADLRNANLRNANLCGANLRNANLCGAKYDEESLLKYFTIGPIGSRNDYLQVFITNTQTILKTGCFSGTIQDLHNKTEREDYKALIPFIENMIEITKKERTP